MLMFLWQAFRKPKYYYVCSKMGILMGLIELEPYLKENVEK